MLARNTQFENLFIEYDDKNSIVSEDGFMLSKEISLKMWKKIHKMENIFI